MVPLSFDWTISIGNIMTFVSVGLMAIWFLSGVKWRLEIVESDLKEIKDSVKEVSRHVVDNLVTSGKVASMDARLNLLIQRVDRVYQVQSEGK